MRQPVRPRSARWAAAVVSVTTLVWLIPSAQGAPAGATTGAPAGATLGTQRPAPARAAAIGLSSPADTGASDITNLGGTGWAVQSSAVATQTGAQISTPGFSTASWLPVANDDAGAPGTEIEALAQDRKSVV